MTTVLVTGGAGYVGSHACKALAAAGITPVTFDNLEAGHRWAVKWGPLVVGDLRDTGKLDYAIRKYKPAGVLHFAAHAYVGESTLNPLKYYDNNVAGTLSLLGSMQAHDIRHIVFSSTCATYGVPKVVPIPEDHPQDPINPYGSSKLVVEWMLRDMAFAHDLRFVCLRYFNAAGADPDGEIGEAHSPETHLIPLVLDAASGDIPEIAIFGDDYDTPDGTCIRDYIHVSDLADAHVRALKWLLSGGDAMFLNLSNGKGFSVRHVIDAAQRVTGLKVPVVVHPRRPGDPPVLIGEASKARALLGWEPQRHELEQQIADAWSWRRRFIQSPSLSAS